MARWTRQTLDGHSTPMENELTGPTAATRVIACPGKVLREAFLFPQNLTAHALSIALRVRGAVSARS